MRTENNLSLSETMAPPSSNSEGARYKHRGPKAK